MPIISVIVPVYKVEPYLRECVDSILNQTFKEFELILVDDGSPDNCPAICDEYKEKDNRVIVIHKENGGLSSARNAGLDYVFANSNSEYISFIDSDDWVHKNYLLFLYNAVNGGDYNVSKCNIVLPHRRNDVKKNFPDIETLDSFDVLSKNLNHDGRFYSTACATLYKRDLFKRLKFKEGVVHEDEFLLNDLCKIGICLVYINHDLYYYRLNPDSITHNPTIKTKLDSCFSYADRCCILSGVPAYKNIFLVYFFSSFYSIETIYNRKYKKEEALYIKSIIMMLLNLSFREKISYKIKIKLMFYYLLTCCKLMKL